MDCHGCQPAAPAYFAGLSALGARTSMSSILPGSPAAQSSVHPQEAPMPLRPGAPRFAHTAAAAVLLALAVNANAAVSPPGVNVRWDQCYIDGGPANKTFACNTNAGTDRLMLSFVLDAPMSDVSGMEIVVDLRSEERR